MTLFRNGKILDKGEWKVAAIWVNEGEIVFVDKQEASLDRLIESGRLNGLNASLGEIEVIECEGISLLPSCIDLNLFPLDKNLNAKTIQNIAKKALLGGVSTIFLNPYTSPSMDNEAMYALIQNLDGNEAVHIFPLIANLTTKPHSNEVILNNIDTLARLNDKAKAIFSNSSIYSGHLYHTMQYAKMLDMPLCVFAFDSHMEQGVAYESTFARGLGLPMMTPLGQLKEVAKVKEMAKFLQVKILFMSVNIASCIDMIYEEDGLYSQVGLPHLVFSERCIADYDTRYKLKPPLLTHSKQEKLLERLRLEKIDLLTSLQSEVSTHCKQRVFEFADESVDGLEYFFSLAYTLLVKKGLISMDYLVRLLSSNAASLLGLRKGAIDRGYEADFMLVDLDASYGINSPLSPYHGMEVYGKIEKMIIGGKAYDGGTPGLLPL